MYYYMQQTIFDFHWTVLFNGWQLEEFTLFIKLHVYLSFNEAAATDGEIIILVAQSFNCDESIKKAFCFY